MMTELQFIFRPMCFTVAWGICLGLDSQLCPPFAPLLCLKITVFSNLKYYGWILCLFTTYQIT